MPPKKVSALGAAAL
jgi:hypothetical protein